MKALSRPLAWILLCLSLISVITIIEIFVTVPIVTTNSNVGRKIRKDFTTHRQTIEIKIDVTSRPLKDEVSAPVRAIPVWQHSYQERTPKPSLRERILEAVNLAAPSHIHLKHLPREETKIPKIVHQLWKTTDIPDNVKDWVKKWESTNPSWTYMFWTDQSARDFVANYYPMLLDRYDGYAYPVQKADLFRYILLYAFGGVYADIDIEPLKELNPIRDWAPCMLATEPDEHAHVKTRFAAPILNNTLACNAFMACRPGHPFIFFLISEVLRNWDDRTKLRKFIRSKNKCPLEDTLYCTGPYLASSTLAFYQRSYGDLLKLHPSENVIAVSPKTFMPTFAEQAIPDLKKICSNKRIKLNDIGKGVCEALNKNGFKNSEITVQSFTNHHWYDSYHYNGKRVTVPLQSVRSNVVLFPNIDFELINNNITIPNR